MNENVITMLMVLVLSFIVSVPYLIQEFRTRRVLRVIDKMVDNLEWYDCKMQCTYNEAILFGNFCSHNGHMDWRLPTAPELFAITSVPSRITISKWFWANYYSPDKGNTIVGYYNTKEVNHFAYHSQPKNLTDFEKLFSLNSFMVDYTPSDSNILTNNLCLVRNKGKIL
jgi:hypothetical protein